jgi:hypothetical protein
MWRREERLRYWLERGSQSQKPGYTLGFIEKLSLKLRLGQCAGNVKEGPLNLNAGAVCLDNALAAITCVKDGFEALGERTVPASESVSEFVECAGAIHPIALLRDSRAMNVRLPDERLAHIRQRSVTIAPICRPFLLSIGGGEVHELKHPYNQPPQLKDGDRFLITNPAVQILTSQISEIPHARTSIRIEELQDSERMGFLREAEILKSIPADRIELLAVFRHVPIEVISQLSFLAEKKAILYSISRDTKPTYTRVHDMAALRDIASKEIHLIPHRTQFRSVSLN